MLSIELSPWWETRRWRRRRGCSCCRLSPTFTRVTWIITRLGQWSSSSACIGLWIPCAGAGYWRRRCQPGKTARYLSWTFGGRWCCATYPYCSYRAARPSASSAKSTYFDSWELEAQRSSCCWSGVTCWADHPEIAPGWAATVTIADIDSFD